MKATSVNVAVSNVAAWVFGLVCGTAAGIWIMGEVRGWRTYSKRPAATADTDADGDGEPGVTHHRITDDEPRFSGAGDSLRGGQPCSQRCRAAHEALRLGETFLRLLIAECGEGEPEVAQLRLLEAV
jgi:hypothetical protein